MAISKAFMNLSGAMDLIKMSKNPLAPVYEAMTNSLESLAQRVNRSEGTVGEIEVRFYFSGLLDDFKDLEQVVIVDNGIGFTEENYNRFREFFDKSKGYDNRGTGRLQYLHRFNRVKVESVFENECQFYRRTIDCNKNNFIRNESVVLEKTAAKSMAVVSLCDYISDVAEKEYFNNLTIDDVASAIKSHFLLRFYLDNQKSGFQAPIVKITFFKGGERTGDREINPENIPKPKAEGEITVPYMKFSNSQNDKPELEVVGGHSEVIKWAHFSLTEEELGKNGIYLCSKDIPVQSIRFDKLKKNEDLKGKHFLTAFYGDVLDDSCNVSDSVDSFTFPDRKEVERMSDDMFIDLNAEYFIVDSLHEQINKAIPGIYKDVLDLRQEQQKDVESIAKAHGIPADLIEKSKISLSDNERTITRKLYKAQSDGLAEKSYKAKQLFESLKVLDPTENNYQEDIYGKTVELSELVEAQNKEELSRYVIRREMVTDILKKILSGELEYQNKPKVVGKNKDREGLIHDLIFKRKNRDAHGLNDLWVLNEEFMHFDGCSDLPLNQIETSDGELFLKDVTEEKIQSLGLKLMKRPDIFLYQNEEKCLLIELKEPNEDLSNHLNQLTKYCSLIANFGTKKITNFYCYLIGENINPITDLDGDYKETVNGDWIRPNVSIVTMDANRNTIANAQIEVIKLSSIHDRAHRRNLSFAASLGISELLQE
jgi:hypothetical protein